MASSNIARLGIVLGVDTAELEVKISKAKQEFGSFAKQIQRDSESAAKDLVALRYATEDYGKTLTKVEQIEREIKAGRYQRAEGSLIEMLRKEAAAYDAKAAAVKKATGAQFAMNEQQKLQLTYQTTDLFTQIASGQSPFIALIQQGGQLKDSMGGLGNMFKALGSFITPVNVALTVAAVVMTATAKAAYDAATEMEQLNDALTLTGKYSEVTEESFQKLAETLSGNTKASLGTTKEALMAVISSGQFTGKSIDAVTQAVITYSQIAGVSAAEATQKLKGGLSGTAEGAKSLNKEMNFLTLEQYKQIEALEKANKKQEAAQVVAVALNTKLEQQRRELGFLEGAWKSVTTAMSNYWDQFKKALSGPTQSETLQSLDKQISDIKQKLSGTAEDEDTAYARGWRKILASLQTSKENLLEIQRLQGRSASSKDVGSGKEKIEEYDKYKGMLKAKAGEVAKAEAEAQFAVAKQGKGELILLELEAEKKLEDARREMNEKNQQEDGRATTQNLEIYKSKAIAIEVEKQEKIRQIRAKYAVAEYNDEEERVKEFNAAWAAENKRKGDLVVNAESQTKEMEFMRESLDLKYKMIYATEQEQRLAQISLQYARKRQEVEGQDPLVLKQLNRQEEIAKMFVTMEEGAKRTQQVFDTVYGNLSSAIDNFVKTGKLSMKDLARSIIQDLIAIQMKAAAMRFLGSLFTMNPMTMTQTDFVNASGGRVFADGGDPPVGMASLVGERGPELFVPKTAGTIVPNHDLGKMGGTTNVTNNYINAIDAKSFENRLLESSNTIWAGYQYANKQLASNGRRA